MPSLTFRRGASVIDCWGRKGWVWRSNRRVTQIYYDDAPKVLQRVPTEYLRRDSESKGHGWRWIKNTWHRREKGWHLWFTEHEPPLNVLVQGEHGTPKRRVIYGGDTVSSTKTIADIYLNSLRDISCQP